MDKSFRWKIAAGLLIAAAATIILVINRGADIGGDLRVAVVNDKGIFLRSVSPERRMVNLMDIGTEVRVWIPGGLGWYRAGTLLKVLSQEKKTSLMAEVLYDNFGFIPAVIETGDESGYLLNYEVVRKWGLLNYLRFRFNEESMMTKRETVDTDLNREGDFLNEVLPRDFADSEILRDDSRITVYNQSDQSGLAAFAARNLQWAGFTVVGIDNVNGDVGSCQVAYGPETEKDNGFSMLKRLFSSCGFEQNNELNDREIEITLGEDYAKMINYQSYNQTP